MQEMQIRSLGQEDTLEKEMATHCNILAWRIPWTEAPGRLQSMGSQRVGYTLTTQQQQHQTDLCFTLPAHWPLHPILPPTVRSWSVFPHSQRTTEGQEPSRAHLSHILACS